MTYFFYLHWIHEKEASKRTFNDDDDDTESKLLLILGDNHMHLGYRFCRHLLWMYIAIKFKKTSSFIKKIKIIENCALTRQKNNKNSISCQCEFVKFLKFPKAADTAIYGCSPSSPVIVLLSLSALCWQQHQHR